MRLKTQKGTCFQIQKKLEKERGTQYVLQIQNMIGRKGLNVSVRDFALRLRKKKTKVVRMAEC